MTRRRIITTFLLVVATPSTQRLPASTPTGSVLRADLGLVTAHGTTRGHQRKVVHLNDAWVIAYSNEQGSHLRLSRDGLHWKEPVTFHSFKTSSSYTLVSWKQRLFLFYTDFQPQRGGKGDGVLVREVMIHERALALGEEPQLVLVDPQGVDFYISAAVGSDGTFWVQSRHIDKSSPDGEVKRDTRLTRTTAPGRLSEWTKPVVPIPVSGKGSIVPTVVPLPDGRAYAFGRTYQDLWGKLDPNPEANRLLGALFDGNRWCEASVLCRRMTHVMGDDRRMSAAFDAASGVLHLLYVDAEAALRHRQLYPSYSEEGWHPPVSEPGTEVYPAPVHCAVASLNPHVTPSRVHVVFGRELHAGSDPRHRTGELRLAIFDGSAWKIEQEPVSEPGFEDNWYPNSAAEVTAAGELGILYMQGPGKGPYHVRFALLRGN